MTQSQSASTIIPCMYREKLKTAPDLQRARQNHTSPVSYWCAPIVVAPKKGTEDIRMCVNSEHLNRYVKCEWCQSATKAQTVANITAENTQIFINTKKGYCQYPLDKTSPRSSPPSDGSSSSAHPTAYHQYPSTITIGWTRHSSDFQAFDASLTTSWYTTKTEQSMSHTSGNSYSDAPRKISPSTGQNGNLHYSRLRWIYPIAKRIPNWPIYLSPRQEQNSLHQQTVLTFNLSSD